MIILTSPITVFLAISGAALLGFLFAWTICRQKYAALMEVNRRTDAELQGLKNTHAKVQAELELHKDSLNSLRLLLQDMETEKLRLKIESDELKHLLAVADDKQRKAEEKVREIEVIREVPVILFREKNTIEDRRQKARQLMRIFRKGFMLEEKKQ